MRGSFKLGEVSFFFERDHTQICLQTKFETFYFRAVGANMGVTQYAAAKKAMIETDSKILKHIPFQIYFLYF